MGVTHLELEEQIRGGAALPDDIRTPTEGPIPHHQAAAKGRAAGHLGENLVWRSGLSVALGPPASDVPLLVLTGGLERTAMQITQTELEPVALGGSGLFFVAIAPALDLGTGVEGTAEAPARLQVVDPAIDRAAKGTSWRRGLPQGI
jgi:hypothetical protein